MKNVPSLFTCFTPELCPAWLCPSCYNQTLRIQKGSFHFDTSAASKKRVSRVDFDHWDVSYVFSGLLECTRLGCLETIAISGEGWCQDKRRTTRNGIEADVINMFRAKVFIPPLPLFIEPEGCPSDIKVQLKVISSLLTGYPTAAANAIRSLLEVLMDDLGVAREKLQPGKPPRDLTLHERLIKSKSITGSHHEGMMALKLLGNAGSHGSTSIKQKHLEDACSLLEQVVVNIYHRPNDVTLQVARLTEAFSQKAKPDA